MTKTIKAGDHTIHVVIDENMKTHENDPVVIRKKEAAEAYIRKHGLPAPYRKSR